MYVGAIYRTPDADVRKFCDYLVDLLETLKLPLKTPHKNFLISYSLTVL